VLRIKYERLLRHWSQPELSRLAQIPQSTISEIERGVSAPSADQLDRLARTFDIQPPALLLLPVVVQVPNVGGLL
jgi:transcriptional regulator with XRE-family HTH domain